MHSEIHLEQGMLIYVNPDGTFRLFDDDEDGQAFGFIVGDCTGDLIAVSIASGTVKINRNQIRRSKYPVFVKKLTRFQILRGV